MTATTHAHQPPADPAKHRAERWFRVAVTALLLLHAGLAFDAARRLSVTHDEYWHLPIGLLNLKTGRFDFDIKNPPLTRMWAALPLLVTANSGPREITTDDTRYGDEFVRANPHSFERWFLLGRGMNILLSLATGLLLAVWAWEWFGTAAALATLAVWTVSPTILGNAALVTPDLGLVLTFTASWYAVWKFAQHPTWRRALCLGLLLGVAQGTKFTAVVLLPLSVPAWFCAWRLWGFMLVPTRRLLLQWALIVGTTLVAWNACYLFQGTGAPLSTYQFGSHSLQRFNTAPPWLRAMPILLPRAYLEGLDRQKSIMESLHPVYLDGQWQEHGFREYFVLALWYKAPHAVQALFALGVLFVVWPGREPRLWGKLLFVLTPGVTVFAISSLSDMQLGLRYVLPVIPGLILVAGQSARWLAWRKYKIRSLLILISLLALPLQVRCHPDELAYFNEAAGGTTGGRAHLLDSNLDWGQGLSALREILKKHQVQNVGLAYFGTPSPEAYGIRYRLPPRRFPRPGWYAVSVNLLENRPYNVRLPVGTYQGVNVSEPRDRYGDFGYFKFFKPIEHAGASIEVYHLTEADVRRWRNAMGR